MKKANKVKNNDTPLMVTIGEIVKAPKQKSAAKANNKIDKIVKNAKTLSAEDLKKQSEKNYAEKVAAENDLVTAYKEKKLKSEALIKKAQELVKAKEKTSKKENAEVAAQ